MVTAAEAAEAAAAVELEEKVSPVQISVTAQFGDPAEGKAVLAKLQAVLDVLKLDTSSVTRMSTSLTDTEGM